MCAVPANRPSTTTPPLKIRHGELRPVPQHTPGMHLSCIQSFATEANKRATVRHPRPEFGHKCFVLRRTGEAEILTAARGQTSLPEGVTVMDMFKGPGWKPCQSSRATEAETYARASPSRKTSRAHSASSDLGLDSRARETRRPTQWRRSPSAQLPNGGRCRSQADTPRIATQHASSCLPCR